MQGQKNSNTMTERLKWFLNRVNHRIFRTHVPNNCPACMIIHAQGQVILNKDHAIYLYDKERAYEASGTRVRYFRNKEERDEYELKQKAPTF